MFEKQNYNHPKSFLHSVLAKNCKFISGGTRQPIGAVCGLLAPYQDKLAPYGVREMALIADSVAAYFSNTQFIKQIFVYFGKVG